MIQDQAQLFQVLEASGFEASSTSRVVATCQDQAEAERIAGYIGELAHIKPMEADTFESWYKRARRAAAGRHMA